MTQFDINRKNLYEDLLGLGYFKDEDGTINFPFEDFCESMADEDTVRTLYNNLIEDGFYQDADGNVTMSEEEFVGNLCDNRVLLDYYPLTENQRGVLLDWEMNRDTTQYNIPTAWHFKKMDAEFLATALRKVVDAHSYVKTRFVRRDGDVMQMRRDGEPAMVSVTTLDSEPDTTFFQERVRPFNPFEDDLYRLEIYRWGEEVYLFKDFHHLVDDGLSEGVFFEDVMKAFTGETLVDESYTAYDFALYEQELRNSDRYEEAQTYFDGLLQGLESFKYPYSHVLDEADAKKGSLTVEISATDQINRFCQQLGITANAYFQTVATQVMHRLTREDNVVMATISNGRALSQMQHIIGMFVKTLPLVYKHADDIKTFEQAAKQMHKQNAETISRDFYPFTEMTQRYGIYPEILYAYQGGVTDSVNTGEDSGIESIPVTLDTAKMPIELTFAPNEQGHYVVLITWDTACYNHHDMEVLAKAMATYAANASQKGMMLADIELLTPDEQQALMKLGQGKKIDYDKNDTFIHAFKRQAEKTPDALAIADNKRELTYREADEQSDTLAHLLVEAGVCPDDFVGVMLERTVLFPVSVLAVHKAAAAYAPLDMEYPNERLSYMMENSEMRVMITTHDVLAMKQQEGGLELGAIKPFFIDDADLTQRTEPILKTTPDNLAYMIYTSGSTGKPKGVMLHQRGLRAYIASIVDVLQLTAEDRISLHRAFSFDSHIHDLYPVLTVGGSVHVMPTEIRKDMKGLRDFIVDRKITGGGYTTSLGAMLLDSYQLPQRYMTLSGEKMVGLVSGDVQLVNGYGPTECTDLITTYCLDKGRVYKDIPVGRPMANGYCFIVDKNNKLVPNGVAGELCFAGVQVGRGYWRLPELTEKVFGDCPFLPLQENGKPMRMYHTGDLCRWNNEDVIECLGRIDNQVKLRGFRVELGEIEAQAQNHEGIEKAVAAVREVVGMQHLVLYYTVKEGCEVSKDELSSFLENSELAEYMRPEIYMPLDDFPYLPNGKVNRRQLPDPVVKAENVVMPENEQEQQIFDIACRILRHDQFGVTTNLVSVGLNSLSAMKLVATILQELNLQVKIADVMKQPTIRAIVALIDHYPLTIDHYPLTIDHYPLTIDRELYPLTENQRGVYLDWEMHRDTTQYNIPHLYKFTQMDAERLADALRTAVDAHPSLKTRFALENGDVVQKLCDEPAQVDLLRKEEQGDVAFFQQQVRPFDLLSDRLYRLTVYEMSDAVYVLFDVHHIVFDGLSTSVFMRDVMTAYEGGEVSKEMVTAFDFALYEQERVTSDEFKEAEQYFDALVGDASALNYPDSAVPSGSKTSPVQVSIAKDAIDAFCSANNVTPNSFLHAAFAHVMGRLTREQTPLYLTISNGRSASIALQECTGMFVKTLPVVVSAKTTDSDSVADYVSAVHQQLQDSYAHEFYPYTRIVERYGLRSGVMFVYQGGLFEGGQVSGVEQIPLELDTIKFPLNVVSYPDGDHYCLNIEYDGERYSREDIETIGKSIANVAQSMATANNVADITMISQEERAALISLSKGAEMDYDQSKTWLDLFEEQVQKAPDALAVADKDGQLTYGELDKWSDELAAWLQNQQVHPDEFVALHMDRTKEFVVAVVGVHKAGAAYLPIDPEYPEDRINFMLSDSEARLVIDKLTIDNGQLTINDKEADVQRSSQRHTLSERTFNVQRSKPSPENLAYMIYTSGSTGQPKGVMLHHRGLMNFTMATIDINELTSADRISSHRSFSFDAHIEDIFPTLAVGASVHIMPQEIRKDLDAIYNFLVKHQITGGGYTTSIAKLLLANYDLQQRFITCGGEALTNVVSDRVQIINVYGPTECTDHIATYKLERGRSYKTIPIGRPFPNGYCFIMDGRGDLMPKGVAGELCYAGPQRGYGYWHLDDLTKEAFTKIQLNNTTYEIYKTGDLARYNEEGLIECLGRIDNQVKLRGFRIEMGEIESAALSCEGIQLAAAEVKTVFGAPHLILYYTTKDGVQVNEESLRRHFAASSLATYMHPEFYVALEAMPLLPNGKVDRRSLPEPQLTMGEIVAPETDMEREVFALATEILGTEEFGVTTNLVAMGLTSLSAMRLSAGIQQHTGCAVRMADIMAHPSVREIAAQMESGAGSQLHAYEERNSYPVTENQRGIILDWETHKNTTQYNVPALYRFTDIDAERLQEALCAAVDAHSYMKTKFMMSKGTYMQRRRYHSLPKVSLTVLDYEPDTSFFQERVRPFNLYSDTLYRIELYKTPQYVYLFFDKHHVIFDGMSGGVFIRDVLRAYQGETIQPEAFSAFDFALYEQELVGSPRFLEAEQRWDDLFGGATALTYPTSQHPSGEDTANVKVRIPADDINRFCTIHGVTANSFLEAAFAEAMQRLTHEDMPLYLTVSNGRDAGAELMNCVGMFVKTLPVVYPSFQKVDVETAELVTAMHAQLQATYEQDFYPYTRLVERHGLRPGMMFVYQGGLEEGNQQIEGADQIALTLDTTKFPLTVFAYPVDEGYELTVEYDGQMYSETDMMTVARTIANIARQMAVKHLISEIKMLDDDEEARIISISTGKHLPVDVGMTFAKAFETRAAACPDAVAVVDKSSQLTYQQLSHYSDVLAHRLLDEGVGADDFVCVMLDRMKEFPLAVLAIHKVGAAYTPLDYEYPNDRLNYMISNSESKVLVTTHAVLKEKASQGGFETGMAKPIFIDDMDFTTPCEPVLMTTPQNLAYMIYTSGSTGRPKGAMLHQAGLWNFINIVIDMEQLTAADRIEGHRSFSFDAHIEDMYAILTLGGSFHIMPTEIRKDPELIYRFLEDHQITGGGYSTAVAALMLNNYPQMKVRFITAGGEKLDGVYSDHIEIINVYGPTECTDDTSYYSIAPGRRVENIPIGKSVANCYNFIVDKYNNLVPQGVPGELCFAGIQVGRGYWKLPDRTAKVFEDCPFVREDAWGRKVRMYHTGDLARYNADGDLEFMGRIDTQVKLRGFRIELGEIENRALQFPGITAAAAEVKKIAQTEHLCLYFTVRPGEQEMTQTKIDEKALRAFLAEKLTDYMVPTLYVQLEKMPLTPNGKINRKMLETPDLSKHLENVPPANDTEAQMLEMARELLPGIEFGVTDNLFDLGMTSLLAMRFAVQLKELHLQVTVASVMRYRNIRAILNGNIRIAWLFDRYDRQKPLLVFAQGIVSTAVTMPKFDLWSQQFNILVIEPIDTHFKYLFEGEDFETALWLYATQLDMLLPQDAEVAAFMGFSWGGKVAYNMARMLHEYTGKTPAVILGDTAFNNELTDREMTVDDVTPDQLQAYGNQIAAEDIVNKFNSVYYMELHDVPVEPYEGHVVFLNAMKDGLTEKKKDNLRIVHEIAADLEVVDFPDSDHDDMFMDQSLTQTYTDILTKLIKHDED
jgi:amino acid adenylation domain-containing protein